jgi:hypothetical protein
MLNDCVTGPGEFGEVAETRELVSVSCSIGSEIGIVRVSSIKLVINSVWVYVSIGMSSSVGVAAFTSRVEAVNMVLVIVEVQRMGSRLELPTGHTMVGGGAPGLLVVTPTAAQASIPYDLTAGKTAAPQAWYVQSRRP